MVVLQSLKSAIQSLSKKLIIKKAKVRAKRNQAFIPVWSDHLTLHALPSPVCFITWQLEEGLNVSILSKSWCRVIESFNIQPNLKKIETITCVKWRLLSTILMKLQNQDLDQKLRLCNHYVAASWPATKLYPNMINNTKILVLRNSVPKKLQICLYIALLNRDILTIPKWQIKLT